MPKFKYVAKNREGKKVKGEFVGNSLIDLYNFLDANDLILVGEPKVVDEDEDSPRRRFIGSRVSRRDVASALRMLLTMIKAGVTITEALEDVATGTGNKRLAQAFKAIKEQIGSGMSLSEAMSNYPDCFDELLIESIKMGEYTGKLDEILKIQIDRLEEEDRMIRTVRQQSIYPVFVSIIVMMVFCAMVFYFMPKMMQSYKEVLGNFPPPPRTRTIMRINHAIISYGWIPIAMMFGVFLFYILSRIFLPLKRVWDSIMWSIPPIREVVKALHLTRLSMALKIGYESGLPVHMCVQMAKKTATSEVFRELMIRAEDIISRGGTLAQAFPREETDHVFHAMVRTGELSGTLPETMAVAVEYYTQLTKEKFNAFTSLFTYGVIILLGGVVAYTVLSVIVPMYELPSVLV